MSVPALKPLLGANRVIPVLTIEDADQAVPLARALAAGGVTVVEVTLRTPPALEAMRRIAEQCPEVLVGAGTILERRQAEQSLFAGAKFLVTPGTSEALAEELLRSGLPCLPGATSASEMIAMREKGFRELKFFPAEASGGPAMLKAVHGPVPDISFCPTGGITVANAGSYLSLPNVLCVGGTWMTPPALLARGDFAGITRLAAETVASLGARAA